MLLPEIRQICVASEISSVSFYVEKYFKIFALHRLECKKEHHVHLQIISRCQNRDLKDVIETRLHSDFSEARKSCHEL